MPVKTAKNISRKELNIATYLKPPTPEQIFSFVTEMGVSRYQFERFFGIPRGTLKQISYGTHKLHPRFWHIIYEKIKPAYGVGIFWGLGNSKPPVSKKVINVVTDNTIHNPLLNKLKEQLHT